VLEEYDTTCIVPPNWSAFADSNGNVILNYIEQSR
jgi:hypothetical protein